MSEEQLEVEKIMQGRRLKISNFYWNVERSDSEVQPKYHFILIFSRAPLLLLSTLREINKSEEVLIEFKF